MIIKCDHCGKEVDKEPRRVNAAKKSGGKLYCSLECSSLARRKRIKCNCA